MANSTSTKYWILDTESNTTPLSYDATLPLRMVWKPSAAAQELLVKNKNGIVVWKETSLTSYPAGRMVWENPGKGNPEPIDGFWLYTLTSGGTLEVDMGI